VAADGLEGVTYNMTSKTVKRLIRGAIGTLYAVVYGVWTMLATGGGHGNFIWFILFMFVEFFGIYFPVMAVLSVNLRPRMTKIVFGSFIFFNLTASFVLIGSWISGFSSESLDDFTKTWERGGATTIIFCAVVHFLPTIVFAILLINALYDSSDAPDDDQMLTLNLN
jgi:hypothetical protein